MIKFVTTHWKLLLIGGLLALAVVQYEASQQSGRAKEKAFEAKIAELNLTRAVAATKAEVMAAMTAREKETAKKVTDAGGRVSSRTAAEISIKDSVQAAPVYAPGASAEVKKAEINWTDPYGRFHLNLPSGLFTRNQRFTFSSTIYVGPDGKTRFANTEFREFSPTTGEEIPTTGANMKVTLQTILEKEPGKGPWHPRLAALVAPGPALGVGGQLNPWRGLTLTGGAIYGKAHNIEGVAGLGWRLRLPFLDSTLGLSGLGAYGKSGFRIVPALTVELSR